MSDVTDFFAPGGPLAAKFPGFEARSQQVQMAQFVDGCVRVGSHGLVEAGTGVGKSLGYLIPLIMKIKAEPTFEWVDVLSGETKKRRRRLVVATASKTLQRQLMDKELPMLKELFPFLTYAMAVGTENYLCGARLASARAEVEQNPALFSEKDDLEYLVAWASKTTSGLRMDLGRPVDNTLWSRVNRQSDLCQCKEFSDSSRCFYRKAKAELLNAHVIIVNHHLLMACLTNEFGGLIPDFDYLVVDEIHSLDDAADGFFGVDLSNSKIDRLNKDLSRVLRSVGDEVKRASEIREVFDEALKSSDKLFAQLTSIMQAQKKDAIRLRQPLLTASDLSQVVMLEKLKTAASMLEDAVEGVTDPQRSLEIRSIARRAKEVSEDMGSWILQDRDNQVYQVLSENGGRRIVAKSNPLELAPYLKAALFDKAFRVIGASATISSGGSMEFMKSKLGVSDAQELVLSSPFDFEHNALIYVANDLPVPKATGIDPVYYNAMVERIIELIRISNGRAMVLCTSAQSMKTLSGRIKLALSDMKIMVQGEDMERHLMVEELRRNPKAVILGLSSFWQGVDVVGDALVMVIIVKLPFPNVGDPLFEARSEKLDAVKARSSFMQLSLPEATIALKQGFGRLIRSASDWGCVALLDTRIVTKPYGRLMLSSLPRTPICYGVSDVRTFFANKVKPEVTIVSASTDGQDATFDEVPF